LTWKDIDIILSVEDAWLLFKSYFLPLRKCRTKNKYSPWFTPDLTALDQHKNILWHSALAMNSLCNLQLFREGKAKASFFKPKFASCSTNYQKILDTVKSMENKSTSFQLPTALRIGNTVTTDKSTIIDNFN
jgi:hypothetical protein